ncbi:crossover junction endonuclease EME1 isoform X1 [Nematostella vectensis]|uniref:crossover junction endonuclease EME1 isoform X1 n=1 Tax=Nematostella vectensis TaxID=45351 RepID=UPI002077747E|nr:crossover junction endonuclease EME1 isoform X1 [Nematostella vectensis]
MAAVMECDSSDDDADLMQPILALKPFTVTQDMIDSVLAVCPDVSVADTGRDLEITRNVSSTINRIFDGQFLSGFSTSTYSTSHQSDCLPIAKFADSQRKGTSTTSIKHNKDLSITDIDSDTDDSDIVVMKGDRIKACSETKQCSTDDNRAAGDTMMKSDSIEYNAKAASKSKKCKVLKRTSKIFDMTLSEDEIDIDFNDIRPSLQSKKFDDNIIDLSFTEDLDVLPKTKSKGSYCSCEGNNTRCTNEGIDRLEQSPDKCEARYSDISPSGSDSDVPLSSVASFSQFRAPASFDSQSQGSDSDCLNSQDSQTSRTSNSSGKRKKLTPEDSLRRKQAAQDKKQAKVREKQAKQQAQEKKRQEKERDKLSKKAEMMNQKSQKKDECLKLIKVCLDPSLIATDPCSEDPILSKLATLDVAYSIEPRLFPGCVTWHRVHLQHRVDEDLQITSEKTFVEEGHVLAQVTADDFVAMVDTYKKVRMGDSTSSSTLESFCRRLMNLYSKKALILAVMGLEKYFRNIKTMQARQFRNAVRGGTEVPTTGKQRKRGRATERVLVTRVDVEEVLVELELRVGCGVRMLDTAQEFADFVGMMTKSLAEAPFKKSQPEAFSFCVDSWNKASVKVTKDGEGLLKAWQQQIQQFTNVSAQMAAAIVSVYPSPQMLLRAYKRCSSDTEASRLLQDIPVRRGAGALATSRRIGPELSRRIHLLFTSSNGKEVLK